MNNWINLHALWKIVVVGLLAGAGLPALFAVGLRAMNTRPATSTAASTPTSTPTSATTGESTAGSSPAGLAVAVLCFAVVLAAMAWGIYSIVHNS